jgi:hypothetical protein
MIVHRGVLAYFYNFVRDLKGSDIHVLWYLRKTMGFSLLSLTQKTEHLSSCPKKIHANDSTKNHQESSKVRCSEKMSVQELLLTSIRKTKLSSAVENYTTNKFSNLWLLK